jgi:hypothetical protein
MKGTPLSYSRTEAELTIVVAFLQQNPSLGPLDIMLLSTLSFQFEVRCWFSYLLEVTPSSDGKGSRTSLGARFLHVLPSERAWLHASLLDAPGSASTMGSQHQKTPTSPGHSHCSSSPFSSSSLARRDIVLQQAGTIEERGLDFEEKFGFSHQEKSCDRAVMISLVLVITT